MKTSATLRRVAALVALAVAAPLSLTACANDPLAEQFRSGDNKNYIAGNQNLTVVCQFHFYTRICDPYRTNRGHVRGLHGGRARSFGKSISLTNRDPNFSEKTQNFWRNRRSR